MKRRINSSAFTLIELLVVISILSIMATIGGLSFNSWQQNLNFRDSIRALYMDMQMIKMEAIKQNAPAVITLTSVDCTVSPPPNLPKPGGSYIAFIDNGNGPGGIANDRIQNGNEPTISQYSIPKHVAICENTFSGNIGFHPTNLPLSLGSIKLKNDKGRSSKISVSVAGNIKIQ